MTLEWMTMEWPNTAPYKSPSSAPFTMGDDGMDDVGMDDDGMDDDGMDEDGEDEDGGDDPCMYLLRPACMETDVCGWDKNVKECFIEDAEMDDETEEPDFIR